MKPVSEKIIKRLTVHPHWRKMVWKRDNYICQKCGENDRSLLIVHHIKFRLTHPELEYDINNGITLCKKCHDNFHNKLRKRDKLGKFI